MGIKVRKVELTDPSPLPDFFHVDEEVFFEEVPLFKRFLWNPSGPGIFSGLQ